MDRPGSRFPNEARVAYRSKAYCKSVIFRCTLRLVPNRAVALGNGHSMKVKISPRCTTSHASPKFSAPAPEHVTAGTRSTAPGSAYVAEYGAGYPRQTRRKNEVREILWNCTDASVRVGFLSH